MARRRKEKSIAEAFSGLVAVNIMFAIISPAYRKLLKSAFNGTGIFLLMICFGVGGLIAVAVAYFLSNSKSDKVTERSRFPVPQFVGPKPFIAEELSYTSFYTDKTRIEQWDKSVLSSIEWKRFEIITKEYLRMTGYDARETRVGADGGVDIRVRKTGTEGSNAIVQCKAWNTYKVGVKPVRELYGIMAAEKVSTGILITSGNFTSEAEDFAEGKIKLVSGTRFLQLIRELSEERQQELLAIALEGDYWTPTCPRCDIKMALRESSKGRNAGGQFWGCENYPRCKQTLVYKSESY